MQVVDLVMERLGFKNQTALTDFLGINRSCPWEWRKRLGGHIPTRHHGTLIDEADRQGVSLTFEDLRGK